MTTVEENVQLLTTSFFDLYEDGVLDLMIQYAQEGRPYFMTRVQTDQRDSTFLKVEVYTPNCDEGMCHKDLEG